MRTSAVEDICAAGDLPPVFIYSVAAADKDTKTGKTVLHDGAHLNPQQILPALFSRFYQLRPSRTTWFSDGVRIAIGWDIAIDDRQLLSAVEHRSYWLTEAQRRSEYARGLETVIRSSLVDVAIREALGIRMPDRRKRMRTIGVNAIQQAASFLPYIAAALEPTMPLAVADIALASVFQEFYATLRRLNIHTAARLRAQSSGRYDEHPAHEPWMQVSNRWRTSHFPFRSAVETHGVSWKRRTALTGVPGGYFFGNVYAIVSELLRQKQPFVGVAHTKS